MSGVIGLDAAAGGWVIARIGADSAWELDFAQSPYDSKMTSDEVYVPSAMVEYLVNNRLSLIDMPVGLVSAATVQDDSMSAELAMHREDAVRRLLRERVPNGGRYVGSVFATPVLEAVYADDYDDASALNRDVLGKAISKQAWNIVYRIKQVQAILAMVPGLRGTMLESHPETVFRLLHADSENGGKLASKRTQEGIDQRLDLLDAALKGAKAAYFDAWHEWGKDMRVQRDDFVDAMVLALCAHGAVSAGKLFTPIVHDGSLREEVLELSDFPAKKLGSDIHARRRDTLLKVAFPESIPRGAQDVPLCMVYCPADFCSTSR